MKIYAIYKQVSQIPELLSYYLKFKPSEKVDITRMYFKEFDGVPYQLYGFIYKKEIYKEFFKQRKKKYYHVRVLVVEDKLIKKLKDFFQTFKISWIKYKDHFDIEENKIKTIDILSSFAEHNYIATTWTELVFNPQDYPYLCPDLIEAMEEKWIKPLSLLTVTAGIDIFTEGNTVPLDVMYDEFEYRDDDSIKVTKEFKKSFGTWYIDFCLHANEAALFVNVFKDELRR